MDAHFWDVLIDRLTFEELEQLELQIRSRKARMHPERVARKVLIIKIGE